MAPKALIAGHKRSHPAYIPSYFPEFPDPHTYIKTPVSQNCFSFSHQKENHKKLEFSFHPFPFFAYKLNMTCSGVFFQTFREPVSEYQILREKAASQRRDVERALTRFMAKTGETQSLFKDDITTFPRESISMEKLALAFTHSSVLLKCVCICVCHQSSQHDRAQFHISVPSCPRSWNCRVLRKRIHLSRTTKQTARTQQGISSL